jgi:hypothetical protein
LFIFLEDASCDSNEEAQKSTAAKAKSSKFYLAIIKNNCFIKRWSQI